MSPFPRSAIGGLLAVLLATSCASTPVTKGADSQTPPTPDVAWPQTFEAVQAAWLFEDQKLFADAVPRSPPAAIEAAFAAQRAQPGFDLRRFVDAHFAMPPSGPQTQVERHDTLRAHIDALWPQLTRTSPTPAAHDSLLPLPQPYVVPGGRFREIYYWDSYFTMRGLVESGEAELSRQMLDNFAHLIDTWGHIPNGNRSYYLSRSQPPFFSHMVMLEARDDPAVAVRYLPQLRREHAFWMDGADALAPGEAFRRAVRLHDGSLLNRYWDDRDVPRPESFMQDRETAEAGRRPHAQVWRDLRAGAESGWDYSSRWLDDPMRLETIRTTAIVPVDLNSLLHRLEATIATACRESGDAACASHYTALADARRRALETHLWHQDGYYTDYDLERRAPRAGITAAALFPLYAGIATQERAQATARIARRELLAPGGLLTTPVNSGQQWDAPNVWAPLQGVAVDGLQRHGEDALAREIAARFTGNVATLFAREHKLVEKYDGDGALQGGGGGEYSLQDGFGWSNGVVLSLFARYPALERDADRVTRAAARQPARAD
ncbi:alpha,alpha-trehalase [Lysobacteraceae bacterium NML93-0399]|nr:alpha,alpha-trehalase [Xanthomonadaceae bacterium NML93-0399]